MGPELMSHHGTIGTVSEAMTMKRGKKQEKGGERELVAGDATHPENRKVWGGSGRWDIGDKGGCCGTGGWKEV